MNAMSRSAKDQGERAPECLGKPNTEVEGEESGSECESVKLQLAMADNRPGETDQNKSSRLGLLMSNCQISSNDLAHAPKASYLTSKPAVEPLKRVEPAVEPKIMKTEDFGARNRAAVSANAWPIPVLPTPGAAVSIVHGANVAAGHTWNRVSSNLPPWHLNWTYPSTRSGGGGGKLIQNPMQFDCERDAALGLPTVAIDGGAFQSGNATSMPADPQAHGPSRGSLGWLPAMLRVPPFGPIIVRAVHSTPIDTLVGTNSSNYLRNRRTRSCAHRGN
ncbi:hypothetical protein B0H13DRAFT_2282500 [Mycena leptocephala]|nr:hypothetical protein B0H13DRAFT_2282500 [Mycena leptocephala]